MAYSPQFVQAMGAASSQGIVTAAGRVLTQTGHERWIAQRNRYRTRTLSKIEADYAGSGIKSKDLADYIAASAPLHCSDAWSYIGRSMASHLTGDSDTARHLAYYGELRAAMGLLATQGIGIFNSRHFVIDSNGSALPLPAGRTHTAAWVALEAWASSQGAADLVGAILKPGGFPIRDWVDALPSGVTWLPIAQDWLRTFGLDLSYMSRDRDARNEASYRPTGLVERRSLSSVEAAEAAIELWDLLEPAPPLAFPTIDRYLLRLTVELAFFSTRGHTARRAPVSFSNDVAAMIQATVPAGADTEVWRAFLLRDEHSADPQVFDLVKRDVSAQGAFDAGRAIRRADHHVGVMTRALLLARIASGACSQMLSAAGMGLSDLEFWWHRYGVDRGLWEVPVDQGDLTDGWADIETATSDLELSIANGTVNSYRDLLTHTAGAVMQLSSFEKVSLWSLAS